jgi:ABC-type oligopeptide transport system substrate-binding subunit
MKKVLVALFALTLAGSLYAGGGCGSSCGSKSADKTTEKSDEVVVVVEGTDSKECDSSTKKCPGMNKSEEA